MGSTDQAQPRLTRLSIDDYVLIEHARIALDRGLTVLSGETGSGKTMLVGAIAFALGERAGTEVVRSGAQRARVTLEIEPDGALRDRLEHDGFSIDPTEDCIVTREMSAAGRSQARINGAPASATQLRALIGQLVDVVGQHEAQRLLAPAYALDAVDRFGGSAAGEARARVGALHARLQELDAALRAQIGDDVKARADFDEARDAVAQIDAVAPQPGEDERLRERRDLLANAERIAGALACAHDALQADEGGAIDALGAAVGALGGIARYGDRLGALARSLEALQSETNDVAAEIAREKETIEFDPSELDAIDMRLAAFERLVRRFGGTLADVLRERDRCARITEDYEDRDARRGVLERERDAATAQLGDAARALSGLRRDAARELERAVGDELAALAMGSARFSAAFETLPEIGASGAERVDFLLAPNAGEPARPLARVASGGELSRILLALVAGLADRRDATTLVFDEIDAGIGGATAVAVGARLGRLARIGQVVCITHLAQLAVWGDTHYVLRKREAGDRTTIEVQTVGAGDASLAEIARMLSGDARRVSLEHAAALVDDVAARKLQPQTLT